MSDLVPARPVFAAQWRGFDREQVTEYVELLEAEVLRLREALRVTADSVPEQRDPEPELQESRPDQEKLEFAEKRAEAIVGQAEQEAVALLEAAEQDAEEIRDQARTFARSLLEDRVTLRRDVARERKQQRAREHRLRRSVQREYKRITAIAQDDSEQLFERTARRCEMRDAESDALYRRTLEEAQERKREAGAAIDHVLREIDRQSTELQALSLPTDGFSSAGGFEADKNLASGGPPTLPHIELPLEDTQATSPERN